MSTTTATQNALLTISQLEKATCPGDLLAIFQNATYLHGQCNRGCSSQTDDVANDRRVCIDWDVKYSHFNFCVLYGYDAKQHAWTKYESRDCRIEFKTKRGLKAVRQFLESIARLDYGQPGRTFSAYRNENRESGWKTY